jgi:hypothetical protein
MKKTLIFALTILSVMTLSSSSFVQEDVHAADALPTCGQPSNLKLISVATGNEVTSVKKGATYIVRAKGGASNIMMCIAEGNYTINTSGCSDASPFVEYGVGQITISSNALRSVTVGVYGKCSGGYQSFTTTNSYAVLP